MFKETLFAALIFIANKYTLSSGFLPSFRGHRIKVIFYPAPCSDKNQKQGGAQAAYSLAWGIVHTSLEGELPFFRCYKWFSHIEVSPEY